MFLQNTLPTPHLHRAPSASSRRAFLLGPLALRALSEVNVIEDLDDELDLMTEFNLSIELDLPAPVEDPTPDGTSDESATAFREPRKPRARENVSGGSDLHA